MTGAVSSFELILRNERTRQYDRIGFLFVLLNLGYLVYTFLSAREIFPRVISGSGAVVLLILFVIYFLQSKKNNRSFIMLTAVLIISFSWMMLQQWWPMLLTPAIGFLYFISRRKMSVMLMKDHIVYPSFPAKTIAWPELSTVILRDGLLTINFRTDRFIQQQVDETVNAVNEQEFNEFCRQQLSK